MNFAHAPGTGQGTIAPEGGCPGNFFTSRKWTFEHGALIIRDHKSEVLAELTSSVNEMGEAPVLVHGDTKLTQSGVILEYLADRSGKFLPRSEDDRLEALRWIIFDNQKVGGNLGPYRFFRNFAKPLGDPIVLEFLKGRALGALAILDKRLSSSPFLLGAEPTIADISMTSYLYYPPAEFGFDLAAQYKNVGAWLDRIKAMPHWVHPYDLMPGHPLPA
jgi:glutathione S-transferase